MHQKLKIKLVAIVAAFSGTAWNSAQATQDGNYLESPPVSRQMQAADSAWGGSFGAVHSAIPPIRSAGSSDFPPIASTRNQSETKAPPIESNDGQPKSKMPPIVSSNRQNEGGLPPIVSNRQPKIVASSLPKPLPAVDTNASKIVKPANRAMMLSPIAAASTSEKNGKQTMTNNVPLRSPMDLGVGFATSAPVDASQDNQVAPAAQWQQSQSRDNAYLNTGFSAAGVPLYSNRQPGTRQDAVSQASPSDAVMMPPIISEESRLVTPRGQAMSRVEPSYAPTYAPENYGPNNYSAPAPTPTYFNAPAMEAPIMGCQDCGAGGSQFAGSAGSVSNCPSCGPNGCFDQNAVDSRQGYFGAMSKARRYYELDALYMTRTDGDIILSNFGGVGSFDPNLGFRLTLGERRDATQGSEVSYFGSIGIESAVNRTDTAGRLSALFTPSTFFNNAEAAPFFNAEIQNERKQSYLHSIEFNKVRWGWDVVKSFVGLRYIFVDDSYDMFSQRRFAAIPPSFSNPTGTPARIETGNYRLHSTNNLIGAHIGRELFYDIGYRLSFSALGKAGVFANINQFEANASNSGTEFLNNKDNNATLSTALELNITAHYQLNRRARLRAGYQGLYMDNVATISDNLSGSLSPFLGTNVNDSDSMYFHGVNIGLEFYR